MNMVCDVVDRVLKSPLGALVHELNPDFKAPKMPFKRMKYTEAIWVIWVFWKSLSVEPFQMFKHFHTWKLLKEGVERLKTH